MCVDCEHHQCQLELRHSLTFAGEQAPNICVSSALSVEVWRQTGSGNKCNQVGGVQNKSDGPEHRALTDSTEQVDDRRTCNTTANILGAAEHV